MKKRGLRLFLVAGLALVGMSAISNNYASADGRYNIDYHNEYRFYSPNDRTYSAQKWTTSAYLMDCTSMSGISEFTAYAMSKGTDVSGGRYYTVKNGSDIALWNKAVENYGKGVSAWINAQKYANGSAYGSWQPDR
ncbi:hypothetical protein CN272_07250 [Bacillus anthracis]|uniref:hypothetical protein n=1 Tax=Bacillus tropicus TaxID=2026188 RepID=UPI000BF7E5E5|nr:hypothetical protein CN272_07250 [Bacillus anthracis]PFD89954.1 hypothetical protein CN275_10925 [Bacillus anthracis]PFR02731.1 hypothetical protein COK10_26795 [Bacillus anthracis]PFT23675.1 hypothetical protein COK52_11830 [Bacillus thuringiensis]PGZ29843.1 hypothetical protein COE50_20925 [Bacillus anthracis]